MKTNSIFVIRGSRFTNIRNKKNYCHCPLQIRSFTIRSLGPASASRIACGYIGYAQRRSFDCLDFLCDAYEQLPDSSRAQIRWVGGRPLFEIVMGCNWQAIRIVEKHRDFMNSFVDEPFDNNKNTPLLSAVQGNCTEVAKWLMNQPGKKPDILKRNEDGVSPIYLAALKGQAEVIKTMLEICT